MMTYRIVHDLPGRMRIRYGRYLIKEDIAKGLRCEISRWPNVRQIDINPMTGSLLFHYEPATRDILLELIDQIDILHFDLTPYLSELHSDSIVVEKQQAKDHYLKNFLKITASRYGLRWFFPAVFSQAATAFFSLKYIGRALNSLLSGHVNVSVLDGTSILVSLLEGDFKTAGDIMYLLKVSDMLQDYTQKKATIDLKNSLSMKIDRVWIAEGDHEREIAMNELQRDDIVIIRSGSMIPIDGEVVKGTALVNEASFTGEPLSKAVVFNDTVFAGSVVEEGTLYIKVRNLQSDSRIAMIVDMITHNESLKAGVQAKAEHLADAIVPYSFAAFFGMYLLTGDLMRATSVLMVDYSCAIKLTTSIAIISAMNEASHHGIMVKGGKYLEAVSQADMIVFDKTGTLTHATPVVQDVVSVHPQYTSKDVLMIAACLEEHFPHSMANAIVLYAQEQDVTHPEMHAEVEYIIAHGIASRINKMRAIIGSSHFVFEDERVPEPPELSDILTSLAEKGTSSTIFLAIDGQLVGIIGIYDPVKCEAKHTISALRDRGIKEIAMLTGDGPIAAKAIASELSITNYRYHVLPEDKSAFVIMMKDAGHKVMMVGDGVNDSPALSAADIAVSMQDSSDIARELSDVTLTSESLDELIVLRDLSTLAMQRITRNYQRIVLFNSLLIIGGAMGFLQPNTSSLLHNSSTFAFSAISTHKLLPKKESISS